MSNGSIFSSFNISSSALSVQRRRMDVIARNLANVSTTRTEEGGPYRREIVTVEENKPKGDFGAIFEKMRLRLKTTRANHFPLPSQRHTDSLQSGGVDVDEIVKDRSAPKMVYDPQHPDANDKGYVAMPNINVITEMVDIIGATRAYEANLTVIDAAKNIVKKSLEI